MIISLLPEAIGVMFGFGYIIFAIKENRICWILGFFSSAIFCVIFFTSSIYMQSTLQVFYCLMSVYGWINWGQGNASVKITAIKLRQHFYAIFFIFMMVYIFSWVFTKLSYEYIFLDLCIAMIALCATYLTSKKFLQCWDYWLVVDALTIYLLVSKDLHISALLYVIYFVMSLVGRYQWINKMNAI
jgi:nicotinamide mononucleotide transporter